MKKIIGIGIGIFALALFVAPVFAAPPQDPVKTTFFDEMKRELDASQCSGKGVVKVTHDVIGDIDSGLSGYWAYDKYNRYIRAWDSSFWNPKGDYTLEFTCTSGCSGVYPHAMSISSFDEDTGVFSGTGSYIPDGSYTWDLDGTLTGTSLAMSIDYTGSNPSYAVSLAGTIAPDGTMSGTATSNVGQSFTWAATEGKAEYVSEYCAILRYLGDFDAVKGKMSPGGNGYTLDGDEDGIFKGGYRAKIRGTLKEVPDNPTTGYLGTFDYACDIDTLACSKWNWVNAYFEPGWAFKNDDYEWWGWLYEAFSHGYWINAVSGNIGDIN